MDTTHELIELFDDGIIPNSSYPVIVYHRAFDFEGGAAADFLEERFARNSWSNAFRWKVYGFHHYHTNTHEVLGAYAGNALLQLGGANGVKLQVRAGDILVLPAGIGHISLSHSGDFAVVGAYPGGAEPDLIRLGDERPDSVREKVDSVPVPDLDPFFGDHPNGMVSFWAGRKSG